MKSWLCCHHLTGLVFLAHFLSLVFPLSDAEINLFFFFYSNQIPLREAEPSLHMVSGLGHIEFECEPASVGLRAVPSIAAGQWAAGQARAPILPGRTEVETTQSIEEVEDPSGKQRRGPM